MALGYATHMTTLSISQEPLKTNSANSIHHISKDFGGWIFI
jgi:hypothetical protein